VIENQIANFNQMLRE